jgi:uncharacterized membrane protein YkvA (DUF1232 family)
MLKFLSLISQLCVAARHLWNDSRVPFIARLHLAAAPLYWLCPLDLNPDFLPGGLLDDIIVVPLLIVSAISLIPRAAFRDAKSAALLGLVCVSFNNWSAGQQWSPSLINFASVPPGSAVSRAANNRLNDQLSGFHARSRVDCLNQVSVEIAGRQPFDVRMFRLLPSKSLDHHVCADNHCRFFLAPINPDEKTSRLKRNPQIVARLASRSDGRDFILTTRGGQIQLYSSESGPDSVNRISASGLNTTMPLPRGDGILFSSVGRGKLQC